MSNFILSRKPLDGSAKSHMKLWHKLRHGQSEDEQEIEVSGHLKWIMHVRSQAAVRRGTLVLLGSFYSGSYGLRQGGNLIQKMSRDGWDVVWSSVHPYQTRYSQEKQEVVLPQVAEKLARRIDETIAWEAEAVDAVLSLLAGERKPVAASEPLVYFGVSAGALVVPALAARAGLPDAAILVCGSASVGELAFLTTLPGATDIKLPDGYSPTPQERHQLAKLTREATRLDPEKLAPLFRGRPVLLLTAGQDAIVPTRLQHELDLAFGKPERWHRWGGHTLTILRLPAQWPRLSKWLQTATINPVPSR